MREYTTTTNMGVAIQSSKKIKSQRIYVKGSDILQRLYYSNQHVFADEQLHIHVKFDKRA